MTVAIVLTGGRRPGPGPGRHRGAAVLLRARCERRRHADAPALLGQHDHELDAVVADYEERLACCLPGRKGHAVITTGALRSPAPEQVATVLAHERAHLRGRHPLCGIGGEGRRSPGRPRKWRGANRMARWGLCGRCARPAAVTGSPLPDPPDPDPPLCQECA
ncbi:M48 family metalloprotease [[Actinomadura] parvosata]|uniref:M48 family metalloprotease n=1 Tax=[Actinomadura] parvosata TaxID=1955412 RepID=UPI00406C3613